MPQAFDEQARCAAMLERPKMLSSSAERACHKRGHPRFPRSERTLSNRGIADPERIFDLSNSLETPHFYRFHRAFLTLSIRPTHVRTPFFAVLTKGISRAS